jgi:predicted DNA-binding protein
MTDKTVLVSYRIPSLLKEVFEEVCKLQDQTSSQVIRQMMRAYINEAGQNALVKKVAGIALNKPEEVAEKAVKSRRKMVI